MKKFLYIPVILVIVIGLTALSGCVGTPEENLTAGELRSDFLANADEIRDYISEYSSLSDGQVRFDWRSPAEYRMEYLNKTNVPPGSTLFQNLTTAVNYDAGENVYKVQPEIDDPPRHDYQAMVREIVSDGDFSVIGAKNEGDRTLYEIEVVTEPWSDIYTPYISSKIQAWIDPESGLAWNITTFYPSDTVNDIIRYDYIDVNTGIGESHFSFTPPQGAKPQCDNTGYGEAMPGGQDSSTVNLMDSPVGGFSGERFMIYLFDYDGLDQILDPDPSASINYTFYSRQADPGTVNLEIYRVAGLYETEPLTMPENLSVTIEPGEFRAEPGEVYTSVVTAHLLPGSEIPDGMWLHLHAEVEGAPDAVTDDWVRIAVNGGTPMSGAGLYHFYQSSGGYCEELLVVPQGESGNAQFFIGTGELDTGTVSVNLTTMPCELNHMPVGEDECPPWPEGIQASVNPDRFTARSFSDYYVDMSFTVDQSVEPGDYCFSVQLRTPTSGFDFAPFTLRVVEG